MSKTVILADRTERTALEVSGAAQYIQGSSRDALTFIFPASEGMETLDAAFSPDNCETITIRDGSEEYTHSGYTVRGGLAKAPVLVTPETADAPAVYEDRITVTMGQRTYVETLLAQMGGSTPEPEGTIEKADLDAAYKEGVNSYE